MLKAVGGLLPTESPSRHFLTAKNRACRSEVDHRGAYDIVLVRVACSGSTIGKDTPPRPLNTVAVQATRVDHVHHAILSMLLAERRGFATLNIEDWLRSAGAMQATPSTDINHTVVSMLPAILPRLASLLVEVRFSCAVGIRAAHTAYVHHAFCSVLFAVRRHRAALKIQER